MDFRQLIQQFMLKNKVKKCKTLNQHNKILYIIETKPYLKPLAFSLEVTISFP